MIFLHFGTCLSATSSLNLLEQWGHWTNEIKIKYDEICDEKEREKCVKKYVKYDKQSTKQSIKQIKLINKKPKDGSGSDGWWT